MLSNLSGTLIARFSGGFRPRLAGALVRRDLAFKGLA